MSGTSDYPGQRLGLPASGVGSMAGIRPRVVAFLIDSVVANVVALVALGGRGPGGLFVLAAFAVEIWIFTAFIGASIGHFVCGLEVLRLDHRPVGPLWAFVRTVLLCLLIPAAIWDRDQRGMHDRAAGTLLVHRR